MDKVKYLEQHERLSCLIRNDTDRLKCMESSLDGLRSTLGLQDPALSSSYGNTVFTGTTEEMNNLSKAIKQKILLRLRLEKQISSALEQMCRNAEQYELESQYAGLIRYRFIMHCTMQKAAAALNINRATAYRWLEPAIALFPMPDQPIDIDKELSLIQAA